MEKLLTHPPEKIIFEAIEQYEPDEIFVGFSGGGDSLLALHTAKNILPNVKAFHANTGIGIEKTREFVRSYCKDIGVELVEIKAKEDCGQDYEQLVMEHGFPGPSMHMKMYSRLKERCVRLLHRRYKKKRGNKIMMLTGIRHDESQVRAGYKNRVVGVVDGVVWVNHVYWYSQQDKYDYLKSNNIKTNPVNNVLGMSGECLCGAFAHKDELELVRLIEPETADYIENLQDEVIKKHPWRWDSKPPKWYQDMGKGQMMLSGEHEDYPHQFQPMCVGCGKTGAVNQ